MGPAYEGRMNPADAEVTYFLTLSRGSFWLAGGDSALAITYFRDWRTALLRAREAHNLGQPQYGAALEDLFRGGAISFSNNPQETQRLSRVVLTTRPFRNAVLETLRNFTLSRTGTGQLELGPRTTARGDEVAPTRGRDLPLIVRRSGSAGQRVRLVGAAYVHGVMYGEWWDQKKCWAMEFV